MFSASPFAACQDIVRRHDPDRYLISLFMPRKSRAALWALFAFNYEIAKTREVVSETTIGLIRLQWWRDGIAEIYEGKDPRQHEVVTPLAEIIKKYDLPKEHFDNLIYAREFDLEGVAPINVEGLMNYCDFTNTPLNLLVLGVLDDNENERIVKQVSQYYGLIGTLRAVPYMLETHRVMLPQDILAQKNVSPKKILDFNKKEEILETIKEILAQKMEFQNDQLLIKTRYIHILKVMTDLYAKRFDRYDSDVFNHQFHQPLNPLTFWFKTIF